MQVFFVLAYENHFYRITAIHCTFSVQILLCLYCVYVTQHDSDDEDEEIIYKEDKLELDKS